MKNFVFAFAILLLASSFTWSAETSTRFHAMDIKYDCHMDDANIDVKDGNIIITHHGRGRSEIEITRDNELYIDGHFIKTNDQQKKLLAEYRLQVMELVDRAKDIGFEGAKIGIEGAKIGLKAVGGVFKLLLEDYDTDDLEEEMEREAAKIEARADKLEARADELEEMADRLEMMAEELSDQIPELHELEWFSY